jgi:hypothetical protein
VLGRDGLLVDPPEIGAQGTWRDPLRAADDERAPDTVLQVGYGGTADELVGNGIAAALSSSTTWR